MRFNQCWVCGRTVDFSEPYAYGDMGHRHEDCIPGFTDYHRKLRRRVEDRLRKDWKSVIQTAKLLDIE